MKIALNNQIIDTENIWKIDEITISGTSASFEIHFFNSKAIRILLLSSVNIGYSIDSDKQREFHKNKIFDEITLFRNELIDIWSNNQSTIPRFDCGINAKILKDHQYDND